MRSQPGEPRFQAGTRRAVLRIYRTSLEPMVYRRLPRVELPEFPSRSAWGANAIRRYSALFSAICRQHNGLNPLKTQISAEGAVNRRV